MYNNKRLFLSIFWVILGVVLMGLSIAEVLDSSIYSGMGGGLIAVGVLQIIRQLRYRRDSEYREKLDTEAADERNKFLRMMSWSWAGVIVVLIEAMGIVAAMVMGQETVMSVLSTSVALLVGAYWISYIILARKY